MTKFKIKNQKRAGKANLLKEKKINKQIFFDFITGLQTMSFIYNHYDENSTMNFNEYQNFIGKVCYIEYEYFVPIHIFKNNEKYYACGFFYEDDYIVDYKIIVSDLNEIKITDYDLSCYLMEGKLI